jgi:hypothetical protein
MRPNRTVIAIVVLAILILLILLGRCYGVTPT